VYIPLDVDYYSHPKTIALLYKFGPAATTWPTKLWCWAARYAAKDGRVRRDAVEFIIGWTGPQGEAIDALLGGGSPEGGYLDAIPDDPKTLQIHDWEERAGMFLRRWQERKDEMKAYNLARRGNSAAANCKKKKKAKLDTAPIHIGDVSDTTRIHPTDEPPPAETPLEGSLEEAREVTKGLLELWNHGREARKWARLTEDKVRKVRTRLKSFTVDKLRSAISNIKESPWHMGTDPKSEGWVATFDWLLESDSKVEKWVIMDRRDAPKPSNSIDELKKKFMGGA